MTPAPQQSRWRRFVAALLNGAALFGFLTLVPSEPYAPVCGRWRDAHVLRGPMREQFVLLLTKAMQNEGFRYWRFGTVILVPVWPLFDWVDFQLNAPRQIASGITKGVRIQGRDYPPPAPLQPMLQEIRLRYGPFPRPGPDGLRIFGPEWYMGEDCNLFRAAVLRVEEMRQPLPDLEARMRGRGYRPRWEAPSAPEAAGQTSTP